MATPLVIVFWETVGALDKKRSFPEGPLIQNLACRVNKFAR
jgi:hypothetical protein